MEVNFTGQSYWVSLPRYLVKRMFLALLEGVLNVVIYLSRVEQMPLKHDGPALVNRRLDRAKREEIHPACLRAGPCFFFSS